MNWKVKNITWSESSRPYYTNEAQTIIKAASEDLFWMMEDAQFGAIVLDPPFTVRAEWKDSSNDALEYIRRNGLYRLLTTDGVIIALTNPIDGFFILGRTSAPEWKWLPQLKIAPVGIHPHARPVTILKELLSTTNGDILDPFMGSGATLLAAQELKRNAVGIEMREDYCEQAARLLHFGREL